MERDRLASFLERFQTALAEGGFLLGVHRLLVACSGGADSTALALLFRDALYGSGGDSRAGPPTSACPELILGHVNHGIRGEEADEDESFARALAEKNHIRFVAERVSVPRLRAQEGLSTEIAARRLRYDVFRRWAEDLDLDAIALAHHRGDQQETVLLRVARGTGLKGLAGISAERLLEGSKRRVRLIRPLLDWSRDDLLEFLRLKRQEYRDDSTNRRLDQPRNRIRHEILPLLERAVHPGARASLERLAGLAGQLARDLEDIASRALEDVLVSTEEGSVRLAPQELAAWPPSVRREVFVRAVSLADPGRLPPSEQAFVRFDELVRREGSGAGTADLGGGLEAELRYGEISIRRASEGRVEPWDQVSLRVGGEPVHWKGWLCGAERSPWPGRSREPLEEWVDEERIGQELILRSRREGDLFHPLGSAGKKKLKEFFRERRIPPRLRESCPLIVSGGEIVWVVGERLAHPFRVRSSTRSTVRLYARRV